MTCSLSTCSNVPLPEDSIASDLISANGARRLGPRETKLRNLGLEAGICKVIDFLTDDLVPRKPQQLVRADAGITVVALVVRDENGYRRMVDDGPKKQFEFSGTVFHEPTGGLNLRGCGGHIAILLAPSIHEARISPAAGDGFGFFGRLIVYPVAISHPLGETATAPLSQHSSAFGLHSEIPYGRITDRPGACSSWWLDYDRSVF